VRSADVVGSRRNVLGALLIAGWASNFWSDTAQTARPQRVPTRGDDKSCAVPTKWLVAARRARSQKRPRRSVVAHRRTPRYPTGDNPRPVPQEQGSLLPILLRCDKSRPVVTPRRGGALPPAPLLRASCFPFRQFLTTTPPLLDAPLRSNTRARTLKPLILNSTIS